MEIAFFFLLTNHGLRAKQLWLVWFANTTDSFKIFLAGFWCCPPLNLLLAEQDPFSAISSSPLSFLIMHSTLSNDSVQATHKPNIKVSPRYTYPYLISGSGPTMHSPTSLLGAGHGSCYVASLRGSFFWFMRAPLKSTTLILISNAFCSLLQCFSGFLLTGEIFNVREGGQ